MEVINAEFSFSNLVTASLTLFFKDNSEIKDWFLSRPLICLIHYSELILFVALFVKSFRAFVFFSSAIFNLDSRAWISISLNGFVLLIAFPFLALIFPMIFYYLLQPMKPFLYLLLNSSSFI